MADNTLLLVGETALVSGAPRLAQQLTSDWRIVPWQAADGAGKLTELAANARAAVGSHFASADLSGSTLRLWQIPFAGHDWLCRRQLPQACAVCNVYEHEAPIAEYVLLAILDAEINLAAIDADFRAGSWRYCMPLHGPFRGEAGGKTIGLIGYGHIAKAVAARAAAFAMRVVAVAPTPRPAPAPLAWLGTTARDLTRLLRESDYVVVTCPLNDQTRGLVGTAEFAAMRPTATLINVARGAVVDERALYDALRRRAIRGAVIDTWYRYPFEVETADPATVKPATLPFQDLDNITMTPHCSAWSRELIDRRWRFVAANLDRFARGEPLRNVLSLPE